jgi:hypothetical protein
MAQHRFRTAALIGEWRPTRREACEDAFRARQARPDSRSPGQPVWAVPGMIETSPSPLRQGTRAPAPRSS